MVLSLVCVPVSAANVAKTIFFDDFSTLPSYIDTTPINADAQVPVLAVIDGQLCPQKDGTQWASGNWGSITIPAATINSAKYTGGNKTVIEFKYTNTFTTYPILMPFINGTKLGQWNNAGISGTYYFIYDKAEHSVAAYVPYQADPIIKNDLAEDSADGLKLGLMFTDHVDSKTSFDYIAVYSYEETFEAEITNVKGTSVTLKTNMPIDTESAALAAGDNAGTLTKVANTINTYNCTFAEELADGSYTLSGTATPIGKDSAITVSEAFTYKKPYATAEEIFFDDFSSEPSYTIDLTTYTTLNDAGTGNSIEISGGKLKLKNTDDNWISATIPASVINSASYTGGDKVVIEYDYNNPWSTKGLFTYINGTNGGLNIGGFGNGVIYTVWDRSAKTMTHYPPIGSTKTAFTNTKTMSADSADGLKLGWMSASRPNSTTPASIDYVAVYSYANTFEGALSDITTTSATLKTNMPINTATSTFTIGETTATATKVANTYNEYKLTFAEELAMGAHTLSASVMPIGATTAQTANIAFECNEVGQSYYFFDDFSKQPTAYSFNTKYMFNNPTATVIDGKLNIDRGETVTDTNNSNFWGVSIPGSAINVPVGADGKAKYIVEFDYATNDYYRTLQTRVAEGYYAAINRGYSATNRVEDGAHYIVCDASGTAQGTAVSYSPSNGALVTGTSVALPSIANGSGVGFVIVDSGEAGIGRGSHTTIDYIAVYPYVTTLDYAVSYVTESSALLTTNMPIDVSTAVIKIGDINCSAEKLPNAFNKYILRPATALTVGTPYSVTLSNIKCIDGTALTAGEAVSVTPVAGVTEITGIEIAENEIGNKVAKISGTNNIVGYSPEVLLGEFSFNGDMLNQANYGKVMLPFAGDFSSNANGPFLWTSEEEDISYKAFIFDSLQNLAPLK